MIRRVYDPATEAGREYLSGTCFGPSSYDHSGWKFYGDGGQKVYATLYDGLLEVTEAVLEADKQAKLDPTVRGSFVGRMRDPYMVESFYGRDGLNSYAAIARMAGETWDHGLEVISRMRDEIAQMPLPKPQDKRRRRLWSEESGDEFSLDRWRSGMPCWETTNRRKMDGPQVITIAVNSCCSGSVKPDDVLWRGAAAVAMTEVVEALGYQVEILATTVVRCVTSDSKDSVVCGYWAKRAGDALDIVNVANAFSAWHYRTIGFGSWSLAVPGKSRLSDGYGWPGLLCPRVARLLDPEIDESKVWAMDNGWTQRDAIEMVRNFLATLSDERQAA